MPKRDAINGLLDRFEKLVAEKGLDVGEVLVTQMKRSLVRMGGATQPAPVKRGRPPGSGKGRGPVEAQASGEAKFDSQYANAGYAGPGQGEGEGPA